MTNAERIDLIQQSAIRDIVSPPGHTVLRSREAMLRISIMLRDGGDRSLMSEPILLNIFPDRTTGRMAIHCIDGTHRLAAGLHSGSWRVIGDIPREMLDVWIEGWGAGESSGPRPRWIPLEVAQDSQILDWVDVSSHPKARGPSAQIPADIPNDSDRIPRRHRGVRIETVVKRTLD